MSPTLKNKKKEVKEETKIKVTPVPSPVVDQKQTTESKLQIDSTEKILILSIDRDNDVGQKTGIPGPIIGINNNKKLATALAIADPEESDANCIFGAIKQYYALIETNNVEIATLTGHSKDNFFYADKNITMQLKQVLEIYPATGVIFVSDGAEDDQVMPLIQNFVPIISKETIIVRQEKSIENTFYFIKKALQDPFFARIVYGIPAIILLLFVFAKQFAFQIIALLFGIYFLIKGFNLEPKIARAYRSFFKKFSLTRISLPFYLGFFFFLVFGIIKGTNLYTANITFDLLHRFIYVLRAVLLYFVLACISWIVGSVIDLFYLKKMYKFGNNLFYIFFIIVFFVLLDLFFQWLLLEFSTKQFIFSIIVGIIILVLLYQFTSLFSIKQEVTSVLIGLPVQSRYGLWVGEVVSIDEKKELIRYKDKTSQTIKAVSKKNFNLGDGRIII